jgi:hypothetical protein
MGEEQGPLGPDPARIEQLRKEKAARQAQRDRREAEENKELAEFQLQAEQEAKRNEMRKQQLLHVRQETEARLERGRAEVREEEKRVLAAEEEVRRTEAMTRKTSQTGGVPSQKSEEVTRRQHEDNITWTQEIQRIKNDLAEIGGEAPAMVEVLDKILILLTYPPNRTPETIREAGKLHEELADRLNEGEEEDINNLIHRFKEARGALRGMRPHETPKKGRIIVGTPKKTESPTSSSSSSRVPHPVPAPAVRRTREREEKHEVVDTSSSRRESSTESAAGIPMMEDGQGEGGGEEYAPGPPLRDHNDTPSKVAVALATKPPPAAAPAAVEAPHPLIFRDAKFEVNTLTDATSVADTELWLRAARSFIRRHPELSGEELATKISKSIDPTSTTYQSARLERFPDAICTAVERDRQQPSSLDQMVVRLTRFRFEPAEPIHKGISRFQNLAREAFPQDADFLKKGLIWLESALEELGKTNATVATKFMLYAGMAKFEERTVKEWRTRLENGGPDRASSPTPSRACASIRNGRTTTLAIECTT